jgi:uncharacterized protein (UPF0548 family)
MMNYKNGSCSRSIYLGYGNKTFRNAKRKVWAMSKAQSLGECVRAAELAWPSMTMTAQLRTKRG